MNPRLAAARCLAGLLSEGASLDVLFATHGAQLAGRDRDFARELTWGTVRWWPRYNALLGQLKSGGPDPVVDALLATGLYQLEHMRVPAHAAVAETVNLCPAVGRQRARGLVNAVLRRFLRERAKLEAGLDEAARLAHPAWLLRRLQAAWPESWPALVAANNQRPALALRVNRLRLDRDEWLAARREQGISAHAAGPAQAVILDTRLPAAEIPGLASGEVSVQDAAAQWTPQLMQLQPGQRVLDACAAPGGKTTHLLEFEPGLAELVALDIDPGRLGRVKENLERLGLQATLVAADATRPEDWWDGRPFDRILLDAPCSGSGVIRRHPDIKLLRREADLAAAARRQRQLLDSLWPLLAPGGRLLYVTCSLLPEENTEVIAAFVASCADARVRVPQIPGGVPAGHCTCLPSGPEQDGFCYACLQKA
ncbi:MAG: 16S rRNA (cytosine(967)-C(5))-methyltransferase RsmB [Gammaproteobacteria bacterium]|nr:16S rRNA (cytosine(967)-C(5))-methyltransferase RsmB [Gammaproteobacteria bacterium]